MNGKRIRFVAAGVILALVAITSTTKPATAAQATTPQKYDNVTLLVVNNMAHLPVFMAQEFGLWSKRGLNVHVKTLGSGGAIAAGLQSGQAEFGSVNAGTGVAPQRASGLLTKLVAPYNNDATNARYDNWLGIVGRADQGITTDPKSIIGKKVGVTGGGTPRAYLSAWLKKNGLKEDQIKSVKMSPPDMLTSLVKGDIAAAVPWDPFYTAAILRLGKNAVKVSDGEGLVTSSIGLGAVDGQLAAKRSIFKRMTEGIVEATWMIRQNLDKAAPVVLSFVSGISKQEAIAAMKRNRYDPRVSICLDWGVEDTAKQLIASGRIKTNLTFTAADLIDPSVLNEVLKEHPEWTADLPPLPTKLSDCKGYTG